MLVWRIYCILIQEIYLRMQMEVRCCLFSSWLKSCILHTHYLTVPLPPPVHTPSSYQFQLLPPCISSLPPPVLFHLLCLPELPSCLSVCCEWNMTSVEARSVPKSTGFWSFWHRAEEINPNRYSWRELKPGGINEEDPNSRTKTDWTQCSMCVRNNTSQFDHF